MFLINRKQSLPLEVLDQPHLSISSPCLRGARICELQLDHEETLACWLLPYLDGHSLLFKSEDPPINTMAQKSNTVVEEP